MLRPNLTAGVVCVRSDYLQNMKQIKESEESGILSKEAAKAARSTEEARYHGSPVKVSP